MIRVTLTNIAFDRGVFFTGKRSGTIALQVEGHSGIQKRGEDIVCSAVSTLAQTAVLSVSMLAGIKPKVQIRDGFIEMVVDTKTLSEKAGQTTQTILATFVIGITEIVKTYPRQVRIEFKDENT